MKIHTEYQAFPSRDSRSQYVSKRFAKYLKTSVLDVGCYEAPLRAILPGVKYTGVDFVGSPDIELNLESVEKIPFNDSTYDCVICIEVLEHLDNFHSIFNELIRVSKKNIIVSLPNCWRDARVPIERGKGQFAHYGLPVDAPKDRHKWFFSATDSLSFFEAQAIKHDLEIIDIFFTEKPKNPIIQLLRKMRYPGNKYHNRYVQTTWVVFQRQQ